MPGNQRVKPFFGEIVEADVPVVWIDIHSTHPSSVSYKARNLGV